MTNHSTLTWLAHFKNLDGQVATWIERLQEYDFEAQHWSGSVKLENGGFIQSVRKIVLGGEGFSVDACQNSSSSVILGTIESEQNEFKRGRTPVFDEDRLTHSITVTTVDMIDKVHDILLVHIRTSSTKSGVLKAIGEMSAPSTDD
ncbi:hypothetical protein Trydic_g17277 [Trypoxylus dichotomus]